MNDLFKVDWAQYGPDLWNGLQNTLLYTALGFTGAALLGLLLALMRTSKRRLLRVPAGIYTEVFKNIPLIVIIYMGYYGLAGDPINVNLEVLPAAVLSLAIFYAAYLSEIFRAALVGVHPGQREAAQALGLNRMTTFGRVIFPQGVRLALAGTNTMMVDMLKSSSLLVIISAAELFQVGKSAASATFRTMEVMIVIAVIYFAMCYPLSQGLLWLERRMHAGKPLSPRRARRLRKARALLGVPQVGSAS
ncbi:amino acid ABC transporter permease [Dactylosporangium sp. AC04546]|uniref:amino acid ABC transporter permease n=1 Tax=Dactylosporangium sp. AC04546 TaxID=2862460 RepID=UPI001EDDA69D|nr:amino acid ABC transporter permease [Dactylosporangium sp. AC04546]WVK86643.1 amino acid ABC transporter permease [Dactylosporangium sp. AC04546]